MLTHGASSRAKNRGSPKRMAGALLPSAIEVGDLSGPVEVRIEPVRDLFRRVVAILAGSGTPGSWLAGRRLVAIDDTVLDC